MGMQCLSPNDSLASCFLECLLMEDLGHQEGSQEFLLEVRLILLTKLEVLIEVGSR